jgi:hypothetical protein
VTSSHRVRHPDGIISSGSGPLAHPSAAAPIPFNRIKLLKYCIELHARRGIAATRAPASCVPPAAATCHQLLLLIVLLPLLLLLLLPPPPPPPLLNLILAPILIFMLDELAACSIVSEPCTSTPASSLRTTCKSAEWHQDATHTRTKSSS